MKIKINSLQAFSAMTLFLDEYYWKTHSGQIGSLLGAMDMTIFTDGQPADPAIWDDWLVCMHGDNELTVQEAYKAVAEFIAEYYSLEPDEYIVTLIEGMRFLPDNQPQNPSLWQQWLKAVEKV